MNNSNCLALLFTEPIYLVPDDCNAVVSKPAEIQENLVAEPLVVYDNLSDDLIFYGNNESKTGIIVYYEDLEWIKPKDKIFLDNILTVIKTSVEKSALFNLAKSPYSHVREIINKMPENKFFIFGIPEKYLSGLNPAKVEIIGNVKVIICPITLTDLAMDQTEKSNLWKKMREVFAL